MIRQYIRAIAATSALATACIAGCAGNDSRNTSGRPGDPVELTIHSATSLTEALPAVIDRFIAAEATTGVAVDIELVLGGSAGLATSLIEGARSNVFVSANAEVTDRVVAAGRANAAATETFAMNEMVLVVPADDPAMITTGLDRLPGALVARCAPEVPCGALAIETLAELGLAVTPRTEERNVRAVLAKVELGEVDAGFVYRTDALISGDKVRVIDLPIVEAPRTSYTATILSEQSESATSQRFVDFLSSPEAGRIFEDHGFVRP